MQNKNGLVGENLFPYPPKFGEKKKMPADYFLIKMELYFLENT